MKTPTVRRLIALLGYVSLLGALPALAQVGPIQPVLVLPDGKLEVTHDRPSFAEDYSISVDVYVTANGSVSSAVVSTSSGNVAADGVAASYMRERKFLPALDAGSKPVDSVVKVNVNMFKRGAKKVVRVTLKPPPVDGETLRVRKLMCADFLWEVNRIKSEAGIKDFSMEVMPFMSAHMYVAQKNLPSELEEKFWDQWPSTLKKVIARCEKDELKFYFTEVLVPALDGTMPTQETTTASAAQ
ncbi:MAG: hypothetical protein ABI769_05790 [Pseudomonadota bacterium]